MRMKIHPFVCENVQLMLLEPLINLSRENTRNALVVMVMGRVVLR